MFSRRKLRKRFNQIGSSIDIQYVLYVNNEQPMTFPTQDACVKYLRAFREENSIFNLSIYRIETYSL